METRSEEPQGADKPQGRALGGGRATWLVAKQAPDGKEPGKDGPVEPTQTPLYLALDDFAAPFGESPAI